MSIVGQLGSESVKGLGAGAYLVTILPSAVFVAATYVLFTADIYPGTTPDSHRSRGFDSVVAKLEQLGPYGNGALVAAVLLLAVVLRPLQVAAVQLLEGYWTRRGVLEGLTTERHLRRYGRARARRTWQRPTGEASTVPFATVASLGRTMHRVDRLKGRARQIVADYPRKENAVLPTLLGNVLRRAETTAGERYGLDTLTSFPRLYPHLHPRINAELATQFNLLDASAAFTIVFWFLAVLTLPVAWLGSFWFVVPLSLLVLGAITYSGAVTTARYHGTLVSTAFDLHRFDMLAGLHVPLPPTPEEERTTNRQVARFLKRGESFADLTIAATYDHSVRSRQSTEDAPPADDGGAD